MSELWKLTAILSLCANAVVISAYYHKVKKLPDFDKDNGYFVCSDIGNEFRAEGKSKTCTKLYETMLRGKLDKLKLEYDLIKLKREKTT